jgi:hypothetical protein
MENRASFPKLQPGEPVVILNFLVVLRDGKNTVDQRVSLRYPEAIGEQKNPMSREVHHEAIVLAIKRYKQENALPESHTVLADQVVFERGRLDKAR